MDSKFPRNSSGSQPAKAKMQGKFSDGDNAMPQNSPPLDFKVVNEHSFCPDSDLHGISPDVGYKTLKQGKPTPNSPDFKNKNY